MTVVTPCPPLTGPWPLRAMTTSGEVFIDQRGIKVAGVLVVVTEEILDNVIAWELGRRVHIEGLPWR